MDELNQKDKDDLMGKNEKVTKNEFRSDEPVDKFPYLKDNKEMYDRLFAAKER